MVLNQINFNQTSGFNSTNIYGNNSVSTQFTNPLLDPMFPNSQMYANPLHNFPMNFNLSSPAHPTFPAGSISIPPPLDNFYNDPFLYGPQYSVAPNDLSYYMNNNGLLAPNVNEVMFNNLEFDENLFHSDAPQQFQPAIPITNNTANALVNSQEFDSSNLDNTDPKGKKMYQRKIKNSTKSHWTEEEDRMLLELVEKYGTKKWCDLARKMPVACRLGKQLRERYNNHLRPGLKKEKWTEEEDVKLIEAHQIVGNKWAEIARIIPNRSESDIKNRWNATKRKCLNLLKKSNSGPKQKSPFEDYVKNIFEGERHAMAGPPNGSDDIVNNQAFGGEPNAPVNVGDGLVDLGLPGFELDENGYLTEDFDTSIFFNMLHD